MQIKYIVLYNYQSKRYEKPGKIVYKDQMSRYKINHRNDK